MVEMNWTESSKFIKNKTCEQNVEKQAEINSRVEYNC